MREAESEHHRCHGHERRSLNSVIHRAADDIEEREAAEKIESALLKVFEEGKVRTRDIGGSATTNEFADAVIDKI